MTEHRRAWNPIKHGWVRLVTDWPRFSFYAFRGEESIRKIGVARTSQVLRLGVTRAMRFPSFTASYTGYFRNISISRPRQRKSFSESLTNGPCQPVRNVMYIGGRNAKPA
jgi:hypothetical protein